MSDAFRNFVCWNPHTRSRVTNTIALDVDPATFRATHSPSMLRRAGAAAGAFTSETEDSFLGDFLNPEHTHVLAAAVGESGAGKSHFIRWLDVESRRADPDGVKHHVVLVPRSSANLHAVVEQVVAGFDGKVVKQVREELSRARGRLTETGAQHRVLDELAFVLGEENLPPRPGRAAPGEDERELRLLLSDFLRDGAVRKWLLETNAVVARLADHIAGSRKAAPVEGALEWQAEHLNVPPTVCQRTGGNAKEAASLLMTDPHSRAMTAGILNAAWSDASAALLGLRRGNFGRALLEIRKELLSRGRELVLLLEDLSVTQGLDEELMEALIVRPNERAGEPLCVLRSVVGLTPDDFAALRDNIRGRLHAWLDLSPPMGDESGSVDSNALAEFAARYLNAARHSQEELNRWHAAGGSSNEALASRCTVGPCPHLSACHSAFGSVELTNGMIGLYPFTADMLTRLDEHASQRQLRGAPKFNPRRLVGQVLNNVLAAAERAVPNGQHPTEHLAKEFDLKTVGSRTQVDLESRYGADGGRYRWALEMYAPQSSVLPGGIASAFGLPVSTAKSPPPSPLLKKQDGPKAAQQPEPEPELLDAFDKWANGGRLEDGDLSKWRIAVYEGIHGRIHWDTEPGFAAVADAFKRNFIHFTGQFPNTEAGDVKLLVGQTALNAVAIRELIRFQSGRLSAGEAEAALRICLPWVDQLADEVRAKLRERVARLRSGNPEARSVAAVLLALGAVLRGDAKFSDPLPTLLSHALQPWPDGPPPRFRGPRWQHLWREFQTREANVVGKSSRDGTLRAWLKKSLACPKGGSTEAGVLDASPVVAALAVFKETGTVPALPKEAADLPELDAIRDLSAKVAELLPKALDEDRKAVEQWLQKVDANFEKDDPKQLFPDLIVALERATDVGVLAGADSLSLADRAKTLARKWSPDVVDDARKSIGAVEPRERLATAACRNADSMSEIAAFLDETADTLAASINKAQSFVDRFTDSGGGLSVTRGDAVRLCQDIPALLDEIIGEAKHGD